MDFNSLGAGQPFYVLTKKEGEKPVLEVGTVKEKTMQQPQYQLQAIPSAMNGMGNQLLMRVVATINGSDRVFADIPVNVEIAQKGDVTFTGSPQAMMQAVDAMMQNAKAEIARDAYNHAVLACGEEMMETLNPRYADEKKRDRTIEELVTHRKETDKKLDKILAFMQDLTSPSKK